MHSVLTATLFIITMVSKQPESMERSMDKEDTMCVHAHAPTCVYGILLSHKKILLLETTWMDLEDIN